MENQADNEHILLRYLLGELNEKEQEEIEVRYFGDNDFFEQLMAAEERLIENHVHNRLSDTERRRFEQYFLRSEDRRQRVEIAELWSEFISRKSAGKQSLPVRGSVIRWPGFKVTTPWIPLAAMLLLTVGGSWLLFERSRLRADLDQATAERDALERERDKLQREVTEQSTRNQQLAQELEKEAQRTDQGESDLPQPADSPARVAAILLTPGLLRGGTKGQTLKIPPKTERVLLWIRINSDDYKDYQAVLNKLDAQERRKVWSSGRLKARSTNTGKAITVRVPAHLFSQEDYILTLNGVSASGAKEVVDEYAFSVLKK